MSKYLVSNWLNWSLVEQAVCPKEKQNKWKYFQIFMIFLLERPDVCLSHGSLHPRVSLILCLMHLVNLYLTSGLQGFSALFKRSRRTNSKEKPKYFFPISSKEMILWTLGIATELNAKRKKSGWWKNIVYVRLGLSWSITPSVNALMPNLISRSKV